MFSQFDPDQHSIVTDGQILSDDVFDERNAAIELAATQLNLRDGHHERWIAFGHF